MTAPRSTGTQALITLAVLVAVGVAVLGGVRSFEAVSSRFGSPLVPLTADGMIVACTALRLAALTRGWRLPGSLLVTYVFIVGTIWLNVAAATGWADAVAHALAPAAYAVLVEMLAHLLRLQLRLAKPRAARVSALTWATSPVITTRVWLHLARTGGEDPREARALVQQVVRMRSRLRSVCPDGWHPFDGARPARTAALHTIRDGLLSAADVAALLPETDRLTPSALLARIDRAALATPTTYGHREEFEPADESAPSAPEPVTMAPADPGADRTAGQCTADAGAPAPVHPVQTAPVHREGAPDREPDRARTGEPVQGAVARTAAGPETAGAAAAPGGGERSDEDLVAELLAHSAAHNAGRPLSQREVRRLLGVGTPKARRLVEACGWSSGSARHGSSPARPSAQADADEQEPNNSNLDLEMSEAR